MIRSILSVLAAVLMMSSPAAAEKVGGVELSDALSQEGSQLVLNGAGIRKKAFLKLYVGSLYLKEKQQDAARIVSADEPMAIRLHIVSGLVSQKKMLAATDEGFKKATGGDTAPIAERIARYNACFSDEIKKHDIYDMVYKPGEGVKVLKNDALKGTIEGLDFKKALFGIWLSDTPADKGLKKGMLGQ